MEMTTVSDKSPIPDWAPMFVDVSVVAFAVKRLAWKSLPRVPLLVDVAEQSYCEGELELRWC